MIDFGVLLRDVFFGDYVHIYPFEIAVIEYTSSGYFWIMFLEACLSRSLHTPSISPLIHLYDVTCHPRPEINIACIQFAHL